MGGFSTGVVIFAMIGAGLNVVLSVRASIKLTSWAGSPLLRLALIVSAVQATIYFFAYWWLLNHQNAGEVWSETVRPIGALAWYLGPWPAFPLALEFHMKKRAETMKRQAVRMLQEVKDETPRCSD